MDAQELKTALDTPEIKALVNAFLLAKVHAEVTREQVDAIYAEILQDIPIYTDVRSRRTEGKRERITDHNKMYLSEDEEACRRIYAEMNKRTRAAGIKPDSMDDEFCPALVAENEFSNIRRQLVNASGKPLGVDYDMFFRRVSWKEDMDKWCDSIVGAIVTMPGFKNPLKG